MKTWARFVLNDGSESEYEIRRGNKTARCVVVGDKIKFKHPPYPDDPFSIQEAIAAVQEVIDEHYDRFIETCKKFNIEPKPKRILVPVAWDVNLKEGEQNGVE